MHAAGSHHEGLQFRLFFMSAATHPSAPQHSSFCPWGPLGGAPSAALYSSPNARLGSCTKGLWHIPVNSHALREYGVWNPSIARHMARVAAVMPFDFDTPPSTSPFPAAVTPLPTKRPAPAEQGPAAAVKVEARVATQRLVAARTTAPEDASALADRTHPVTPPPHGIGGLPAGPKGRVVRSSASTSLTSSAPPPRAPISGHKKGQLPQQKLPVGTPPALPTEAKTPRTSPTASAGSPTHADPLPSPTPLPPSSPLAAEMSLQCSSLFPQHALKDTRAQAPSTGELLASTDAHDTGKKPGSPPPMHVATSPEPPLPAKGSPQPTAAPTPLPQDALKGKSVPSGADLSSATPATDRHDIPQDCQAPSATQADELAARLPVSQTEGPPPAPVLPGEPSHGGESLRAASRRHRPRREADALVLPATDCTARATAEALELSQFIEGRSTRRRLSEVHAILAPTPPVTAGAPPTPVEEASNSKQDQVPPPKRAARGRGGRTTGDRSSPPQAPAACLVVRDGTSHPCDDFAAAPSSMPPPQAGRGRRPRNGSVSVAVATPAGATPLHSSHGKSCKPGPKQGVPHVSAEAATTPTSAAPSPMSVAQSPSAAGSADASAGAVSAAFKRRRLSGKAGPDGTDNGVSGGNGAGGDSVADAGGSEEGGGDVPPVLVNVLGGPPGDLLPRMRLFYERFVVPHRWRTVDWSIPPSLALGVGLGCGKAITSPWPALITRCVRSPKSRP